MLNRQPKFINKSVKGRSIISNLEVDEGLMLDCNIDLTENNKYDIATKDIRLKSVFTNNFDTVNAEISQANIQTNNITSANVNLAEITQANIQSSNITIGNIDNLTCGTLQINSTDNGFMIGNKRYIDKIAEFIDVDNHFNLPVDYYNTPLRFLYDNDSDKYEISFRYRDNHFAIDNIHQNLKISMGTEIPLTLEDNQLTGVYKMKLGYDDYTIKIQDNKLFSPLDGINPIYITSGNSPLIGLRYTCPLQVNNEGYLGVNVDENTIQLNTSECTLRVNPNLTIENLMVYSTGSFNEIFVSNGSIITSTLSNTFISNGSLINSTINNFKVSKKNV